jgi:hypothetical protein
VVKLKPNFIMAKPKISKSPLVNNPPLGLTQPELRVTYGTGGIKSPTSEQVISLPEFYQILLTEHQTETEGLYEPCHRNVTIWKRRQQCERIKATFPFMIAGTASDVLAFAPDETDDISEWRTPLGLVVLSFRYDFVRLDALATIANRMQLQEQVLAVPLLGASALLVFRGLEEDCLLHVLAATGPMMSYLERQYSIINSLEVACPELRCRLRMVDVTATSPHSIGFDPLAWLRPRLAEGYPLFPIELAQDKTRACEQNPARKWSYGLPLR